MRALVIRHDPGVHAESSLAASDAGLGYLDDRDATELRVEVGAHWAVVPWQLQEQRCGSMAGDCRGMPE